MASGPVSRLAPEDRWALRTILLGVAAASAILAIIVFLLHNVADRNDFLYESWPSYQALEAGHLLTFLREAPAYIGAAIWRAPIALIAIACGAGWRLTFYLTAVPCFAAPGLFGLWWARRLSGDTARRRRVLWLFVLVTVLDPLVWFTGLLGHPEELVGITLALAAVLVASDGRDLLALVLIVAAVLDKPGLGELIPVVLVARGGREAALALAAGFILLLAYALYNLTGLHTVISLHPLIAGAGGAFYPFQLLWWVGEGAWVVQHEHVLLAPVCVAIVGLWWRRRREDVAALAPRARDRELLWLTALLLLFRTAFEPWDNIYYNLPLVFCLLCLESEAEIPWMTIAASAGALILVPTNRIIPISGTAQAVLYTLVAVPVLLILARVGFRAAGSRPAARAGRQAVPVPSGGRRSWRSSPDR